MLGTRTDKLSFILLLLGQSYGYLAQPPQIEAPLGSNNVLPPAQDSEYFDLSHTFDNETVYFPFQRFAFLHMKDLGPVFNVTGDGKRRFTYAQYSFCTSEHGGTHIDAPFHFNMFGWKLNEIPLDRLMNIPTVIVDAEPLVFSQQNPSKFVLTITHFLDHEAKFGKIQPGSLILINFGWSRYWPDKIRYLGWDNSTVAFGGEPQFNFPGCAPDVGDWLVRERSIVGLGVDTMSPEASTYVNQGNNYVHLALLEANVYIMEMVANLEYLLERTRPRDRQSSRTCKDLRSFVLPMKTRGTGGPVRLVAQCQRW